MCVRLRSQRHGILVGKIFFNSLKLGGREGGGEDVHEIELSDYTWLSPEIVHAGSGDAPVR